MRTGKIARLPYTLRCQLNSRLLDGEPCRVLLEWLNALPEVQSVLAKEFGGRPIAPCNLSEWIRGGYQEWLARQGAQDLLGGIFRH